MVSKETLRQVVIRQKQDLSQKGGSVRRELLSVLLSWFKDNRIIILTGVRRCGKSTLLQQIMQQKAEWCYVNFEDERFLDFRAQEFEMLNEVLLEVYGSSKIYFFDEIQNIDKFETFVRRLQDEGKKVILTGSNAHLLSKEFGTRLTGRYKSFEVYPFSFREFLSFHKIEWTPTDFYDTEKKVRILNLCREYVVSGGLPEYLKNKDKEYVRTVYENILYKDIITRYSLRREKIMKELINILTTNATLPFTYNSLKKTLGLANAITVKEYISYLNNSYLFFELLKYSYSLKQQLGSPRKIYLVDTAFQQICGLNFTQNEGRAIENVVFIEFKRMAQELYYFTGKHECDFVIKEGTKITKALQVVSELHPENKERELQGLWEALEEYKLNQGTIITLEQEDEIRQEGKRILIIPLWKWLLR